MTELTGRDLDVVLARAIGWRPLWVGGRWHIAREYGGESEVMPRYHESVDALIRDVLPKCRELGNTQWGLETLCGGGIRASIGPESALPTWYEECADTPALALARACLSALEAK